MAHFKVPELLSKKGIRVPRIYDIMIERGLVKKLEVENFLDLYSRLADGYTRDGKEIGNVEPLKWHEQQDFARLQLKMLDARINLGDKVAERQKKDFEGEVGVMFALREPLNLGYL